MIAKPISPPLSIELGALGWAIDCVGCDDVAEALASILTGWQVALVRHGPPGTGPAPRAGRRATITRRRKRYAFASALSAPPVQWTQHEDRTPQEVLYDLHDLCIDWYLADHPNELCLHAAAVELDGQVVCIPSVRKAGKSTLVAALAAAGARVFGDDVLAIHRAETGPDGRTARATPAAEAIGLGFAPRLRRPLPRGLEPAFRQYIARHAGIGDHRWLYLALDPAQAVPLGERKPIGAIVLLQRDPAAPAATLTPLPPGEVIAELVQQNIAKGIDAADALAAWHHLAETVPCQRLTYARLGDAVAAVRSSLTHPPERMAATPSRGRSRSGPSIRRAAGYQQHTATDGTVFLAKPGSDEVHRLDPLSAALWQALRRHQPQAGLVDLVAAAFPDTPRSTIERDIAGLVQSLINRGLLHATAPG